MSASADVDFRVGERRRLVELQPLVAAAIIQAVTKLVIKTTPQMADDQP